MKDHRNAIVVKAITEDSDRTISSSQQVDRFKDEYNGDVIEPLYNPEQLAVLSEESDILQPCVDAYKVNIAGFGIEIVYDNDYDSLSEVEKTALDKEKSMYEQFFKYCNYDESFTSLMKKSIEDQERVGWGCLEIINDGSGRPADLIYVPAYLIRICKGSSDLVDVQTVIIDGEGKEITITRKRRFRKFVQMVDAHKVYFKEFGDPRHMDSETGEYSDNPMDDSEATAILFFNIHCPYTPYGMPRYMGQLLNIAGSRKAQELNYRYFDGGRHIPLAITVANGKLTQESIDRLSDTKGSRAQHKYLILEAEGDGSEITTIGGDDNNKSRVEIKFEKLAEIMQKDGLFQEYCQNNRDVIRSAFRLPPIYTGESSDYNRATADTARQITEEQVFQPEREELAYKINNLLKSVLGVYNVSMKFKAPKITDSTEIAAALAPFVTGGAATPNMLIGALNELLGKKYEPTKEDWGDVPLQVWLKNKEVQSFQGGFRPSNGTNPLDLEKGVDQRSEVYTILKTLMETIREAVTDES